MIIINQLRVGRRLHYELFFSSQRSDSCALPTSRSDRTAVAKIYPALTTTIKRISSTVDGLLESSSMYCNKTRFDGLSRTNTRALSSTTTFVVNPRDKARLPGKFNTIDLLIFFCFIFSLIFFTTYRRPSRSSRRRNQQRIKRCFEHFCLSNSTPDVIKFAIRPAGRDTFGDCHRISEVYRTHRRADSRFIADSRPPTVDREPAPAQTRRFFSRRATLTAVL